MPTTNSIQTTAKRLVSRIASLNSVAIAFSGGVDSAVVAMAAYLALDNRAVAVTAVSPSLAESERRIARSEAAAIGIRHVEVTTAEFQRPEYRRNAGDRCFFCKDTLYSLTAARLQELGVSCIINGANTDDLGDYRPGMQAARDHQVLSPLIEEGIDKKTVRQLARFWNLSVAEKPASPCLSSRIAYGVEVTEERVRRVESAEAIIKDLTGVQELRVRHEANELARIEVPIADISAMVTDPLRAEVTSRLKDLGFRAVTIDLQGFRSGNLNDSLPVVELRLK